MFRFFLERVDITEIRKRYRDIQLPAKYRNEEASVDEHDERQSEESSADANIDLALGIKYCWRIYNYLPILRTFLFILFRKHRIKKENRKNNCGLRPVRETNIL